MKFIKISTVIFICLTLLAACESTPKDTTSDTTITNTSKKVSDSVINTNLNKIEIIGMEELPGSKNSNNYPILSVTIEYTNKGKHNNSPLKAVISDMSVFQQIQGTQEKLSGTTIYFPVNYETTLVQMANSEVKPGDKIQAIIGFQILYPGSPIQFTDEADNFNKIIDTTPQ